MSGGVRKVTPRERAITEQLARIWDDGYTSGWRDGVNDANAEDPDATGRNPYRPYRQTDES